MKRAAALFALTVAACTQRVPVATPTTGPAQTASTPNPARVASLAGEWRVAAIDGRELNEPYGLALSADARAIWWQPRCAGMVRGYRIAGGGVSFGPNPDLPPRQAGDPTPPVCAIGLPPRLRAVFEALDSATGIGRTAANGVEIAGGGHSVLLFSQ